MTWMQFVAALVDSLAWPIAVVMISFTFRKAINRFIDRIKLRRIAGKGIEAEFDERLAEVGEAIALERRQESPETDLRETGERISQTAEKDLIEHAPLGAVVAAWGEVEYKLADVIEQLKLDERPAKRLSATRAAHVLAKHGVISESTQSNIAGLAHLRNIAVHGAHQDNSWFDPERAREFVEYTKMMLWSIDYDLRRYRETGQHRDNESRDES